MPAPPSPGLELVEDVAGERRAWRVRRVAFVALALVVSAAVAGAFGAGPLARARVEREGVRLAYDRLLRVQTPATLTLEVPVPEGTPGARRLWLDRGWVERVRLTRLVPDPEVVEAADDRLWLVVRTGAAAGRARLTVDYAPEALGALALRAGVEGGPTLAVRQWVYP